MIKYNIQFFGGRGAGSNISNSQGESVKISKEKDIWSERHKPSQEPAVDQVLSATRDMNDEYGIMDNVDTVSVANMNKAGIIAFYDPDENKVVINRAYTNLTKLADAYDQSVNNGFHPKLGNKTAMEAVTAHELAHALADKINEARRKGGYSKLDANSEIVINAFKTTYPSKSNSQLALNKERNNISGYAAKNYHETLAEAVADVYCNGKKAKKFSKAIVTELKKTVKAEL